MPKSALQIKKEQEALRDAKVEEMLRRQTHVVLTKIRQSEVDPKAIGRRLVETLGSFVVRPLSTFSRPLKTRNRQAIRLAYAMHLFGTYPVAPFIQSAFSAASLETSVQRNDEFIAINLFLAVRSGKSVFKEVTREYLSKKETHALTTCRFDFSIKQAFVYSIALQDTDVGNAQRIARSVISEHYTFGDDFWREVIRFFARTPVSRSELSDIVDYLRVRHAQDRTYSIKGRTVLTLKRAHEEWVREMARTKELGNHTWAGLPYRDLVFTTRSGRHEWKIFQICDSKTLGREGTMMRHCVLSYRQQCSNGTIAIFTLRHREVQCHHDHALHTLKCHDGSLICDLCEFDKCLTIEVSMSGEVRQVRGFANRLPAAFEKEAVEFWMGQNGLRYSRYSW